jgi:tryptophanyl-tRNA synthetase
MRVLSGMRPTGPLHLGHYFGALANWIRLQETYDCYFFIADWHALTTHYAEDTRLVPKNSLEIAKDWLASGLDPAKCTLFVQSAVVEHAELNLLLSMVTPLEWLERVPTYREQIAQLKDKDLSTYGFLGYPLLQTADIVMYDADCVPVGEDQVPHIELAREIVRRMNFLFGLRVKQELFSGGPEAEKDRGKILGALPAKQIRWSAENGGEPELLAAVREVGIENFFERIGRARNYFRYAPVLKEPQPLLTETPRLPGTDGRRMAKSYGNAIWLGESAESLHRKIRGMMTDPQRVHRSDPGRPEICPVFAYHKLFSTPEVIAWSEQGCRSAGIGCVECKEALVSGVRQFLEPIQARRRALDADPECVEKILKDGSSRARQVARRTMRRVREAIFGGGRGFPRQRAAARRSATAAGPTEAR